MNGFCHEDDFLIAAAENQIESFGKMFQEKFGTRRIGLTGAAEHLDKELELLRRSVRVISNEVMEIEADQKHVHLITGRSRTHSKQHCPNSESEIECN